MKQKNIAHIPIADAQKYTYEQYNADAEELKPILAAELGVLDDVQTGFFSAQDKFEVHLEKSAYYMLVLQVQCHLLSSCIQ